MDSLYLEISIFLSHMYLNKIDFLKIQYWKIFSRLIVIKLYFTSLVIFYSSLF